jgi:NTP pyrophosphatase (non-canonical NTP hydrolase)
MQIRSA